MTDLEPLFHHHGLQRLIPHLPQLARPSIRLLETEKTTDAGYSRLGGLPDTPADFTWPHSHDSLDKPLIFLGQLNWGELKPHDIENILPSSGGVLFFVNPGNADSCVVPLAEFAPQPVAPPPDLAYILPVQHVRPHCEWTLPYYGFHGTIGGGDSRRCFFDVHWPEIEFFELTDAERNAYEQLIAGIAHPGHFRHRLLGHSDTIQNPMRLDLERQARGISLDYENYLTLCDPQAPLTRGLKQQALESDWQLAFQISSFCSHHELWGDGGTYYFWIKKNDLNSPSPRFICEGQCG
ncbi:DUF1963 domain-containing protein [bacterium]|nr:MAG: DUF1963 domain-containing protein [bacterium]